VDWFLVSGLTNFVWSFYPVHLFIMWFSGTTIFSTAHLVLMCVGCVEWKQSTAFQKFIMYSPSTSGQGQIRLLSLAEDCEHFSWFELPYLMVKPTYLLGYRLIFVVSHRIDVL
jgi:hypothetical protein